MTKYTFDFKMGEEVYLRTDPDQDKRLVTGILISGENITYRLALGSYPVTWHQGFEISRDRDIVLATSN